MEHVLVVPRAAFFAGNWRQGFSALSPTDAQKLTTQFASAAFFTPRPAAEDNPEWKQPIPYCLITRGSEVFCVQRTQAGTEGRLRGLYSVGLGGHVGPEDGAAEDPNTLGRALLRELNEELSLPRQPPPALPLVGLLNDDSNQVGRVHVGLVYRWELPPPREGVENIAIREISKLRGGFRRLVELQELWQDPGRFESWSQIVIHALLNPPPHGGKHNSTESD